MGSNRTSVAFTLLGVGMLTILGTTNKNYSTRRAQDLSSRLQEIVPEPNVDKNCWARLYLDEIGLNDCLVGFEVDLKFRGNERGTGIDVYNSGTKIGTASLDKVDNYLSKIGKR